MPFRNPVSGPRIVPFGQPRTASDVLRNGRPGFRVTQSFNHYDAFFHNRIHGAMDIGNYYCGDSVLAMEAGTVTLLRDPNGALGVRVSHANGYKSEVWHLAAYNKRLYNGLAVRKGLTIGKVGRTGLDIGGCHAHVVMYDPAGRAVDPWPFMNQ